MLLALGQANGKVVLTTFGPSAYDALGLTGLELSEYLSNVFFIITWSVSIRGELRRYHTSFCTPDVPGSISGRDTKKK